MTAEIFDRGYRPYDGPRSGSTGAMKSVFVSSIQRALGLRRKFRFKIIPIIAIFIAYVPALIFLGLSILLPGEIASELTAEYVDYYDFLSIALMLFSAFVAPELLSTDRRTGLFGLYLASPLNRFSYLAAKVASLVVVLLLITMVPLLFLLIGYTLVGLGPDGFSETVKLIGRIVASGFVMSAFYALLGMAAASLTKRQGFAAAGIVMTLIGSLFLTGGLVEDGGMDDWLFLFAMPLLPREVVGVIFDEALDVTTVSKLTEVGAYLGVTALFAAVVIWAYQRLAVTR